MKFDEIDFSDEFTKIATEQEFVEENRHHNLGDARLKVIYSEHKKALGANENVGKGDEAATKAAEVTRSAAQKKLEDRNKRVSGQTATATPEPTK